MKKLLQLSAFLLFSICFGQTPIYQYNFDLSLCSGTNCFSARNGNNAGTSSYAADRFSMNAKVATLVNPNFLEASLPSLPVASSSRTISFWMANNAVTSAQTNVFSSVNNTGGKAFSLTQTSGVTYLSRNGTYFEVPFVVSQGMWNFYTLTFDGTVAKIYINGTLRGTNNASPTSWVDSASSFISFGRSYISNQTLSNMALDELKIYNTVLTDTQIANLYLEDPFSTINLVAYYGFENNNNSHNGQNNLQNVTGTSSYATGVLGNALDLTTTTSNALFSQTLGSLLTSNPTNYTVCFWMKRAATQPNNLSTPVELFASHYLRSGSNVNTLSGGYASSATIFEGGGNTPVINFNNYIHVAIVHNFGTSDAGRVYIDGVPSYNVVTTAPNIHRFNNKIYIGSGGNAAGDEQDSKRFIGQIDELYVYNRALTLPEIKGVKNNTAVSQLTNNVFNTSNPRFSMFPNPAKNIMNVEMEKDLQSVEIYSLQGQKVLTGQDKQINISNLSSGMYMVRVQDVDGGVATQKLIKE